MQNNEPLFEAIVEDLVKQSYSLQSAQAPKEICEALLLQAKEQQQTFNPAKIGRNTGQFEDKNIRSDKTKWIKGNTKAEQDWLNWCEGLKEYLNRSLYIGLKSFECHFSVYEPGDFYQKHVDAFKGKSNRKVSMVLYLNKDWQEQDEGQLVVYAKDGSSFKVNPTFSSFIVFLSEDIPHEVLASQKDRYAIACWFRID